MGSVISVAWTALCVIATIIVTFGVGMEYADPTAWSPTLTSRLGTSWLVTGLCVIWLPEIYRSSREGVPEDEREQNKCSHFGYDLTGNISGACPECGMKHFGRGNQEKR
jgi:hypothetical protein